MEGLGYLVHRKPIPIVEHKCFEFVWLHRVSSGVHYSFEIPADVERLLYTVVSDLWCVVTIE